MNFEQYLSDFNSTIDIYAFLLNVGIVTVLAFIVKLFYIQYGRAVSNRRKFSNNFVPLALATLLIITVIKSSVALSLGLVGALSIVRFRAAIKDPEELTYLFLVIGLGLIGGANKPLLAVVSFAIFLPLLYLNNRFRSQLSPVSNKASLHIITNMPTVQSITEILAKHTTYLELKRADLEDTHINATFFCRFETPDALDKGFEEIKGIDDAAQFSFVDQPDLLL